MSIADTVSSKLAAIHQEHRRRWFEWAHSIAEGGRSPTPLDVLETAGALGISDPGQALEHDALVVAELRNIEAAIDSCRTTRATLLKPWGGSTDSLRAAVEAAESKTRKLREELEQVEGNHSESFWGVAAAKLKKANPRLFAVEGSR